MTVKNLRPVVSYHRNDKNKIGAGAYGRPTYRNDGEKLVMSVNDSA
jgi:hypothetical protein